VADAAQQEYAFRRSITIGSWRPSFIGWSIDGRVYEGARDARWDGLDSHAPAVKVAVRHQNSRASRLGLRTGWMRRIVDVRDARSQRIGAIPGVFWLAAGSPGGASNSRLRLRCESAAKEEHDAPTVIQVTRF
jgi:hypothetical protein